MKHYFIRGLSWQLNERLQEVSREIGLSSFFVPGVGEGLLVSEEHMPRALDVIGMRLDGEEDTPQREVVIAHLSRLGRRERREALRREEGRREAERVHTVTYERYHHWNGHQPERFQAIAEELLLPVVRKDVVMDVPHRETVPQSSDGKFRIHFWSSPSGRPTHRLAPAEIWGIPVDCVDAPFPATGDGIAICDESGYAVAELFEDDLYIHHDLCHNGTERELEIFRRLLEEVAILKGASREEIEERRRRQEEERRLESRKSYAQACSKRTARLIERAERTVQQGKETIRQLQNEIVEKVRVVADAERTAAQLKEDEGDRTAQYELEFDRLNEIPKVLKVEVAGGKLKVFTDTLYATDPRSEKVHEIGKFRIEIGLGDAMDIRWFNLDRQVSAFWDRSQAPHVGSDGIACLGSAAEILPELIGSYEFAAAVMVAIQFVETVNVDDSAGSYISSWPLAEGQESAT